MSGLSRVWPRSFLLRLKFVYCVVLLNNICHWSSVFNLQESGQISVVGVTRTEWYNLLYWMLQGGLPNFTYVAISAAKPISFGSRYGMWTTDSPWKKLSKDTSDGSWMWDCVFSVDGQNNNETMVNGDR